MESTKSLKVIRLRASSSRNSLTRRPQRIGIIARPTKASPSTANWGRSITDSLSKASANSRTPHLGTRLRNALKLIPLTFPSYSTTTSVVVHTDLRPIAPFGGQRYFYPNGHRTQLKRSHDPRRRRVDSGCPPGSDRIGGAIRGLLQLRRAIPV